MQLHRLRWSRCAWWKLRPVQWSMRSRSKRPRSVRCVPRCSEFHSDGHINGFSLGPPMAWGSFSMGLRLEPCQGSQQSNACNHVQHYLYQISATNSLLVLGDWQGRRKCACMRSRAGKSFRLIWFNPILNQQVCGIYLHDRYIDGVKKRMFSVNLILMFPLHECMQLRIQRHSDSWAPLLAGAESDETWRDRISTVESVLLGSHCICNMGCVLFFGYLTYMFVAAFNI